MTQMQRMITDYIIRANQSKSVSSVFYSKKLQTLAKPRKIRVYFPAQMPHICKTMSTDIYIAHCLSPMGLLEIRSTAEIVTAIHFRNEKKREDTVEQPECIQQCMAQLQEYFAGTRQHFDFAYAQEGTGFQQKVWAELEKIPFGERITYTEQTRRLGDMKALRAVASANGKNSLAIVVPCHRVIGSNGKLTGYAGGLDKKLWLIEHERQFMQPEEGKLF